MFIREVVAREWESGKRSRRLGIVLKRNEIN
jgi:hypothetical protein